jgi:hypothetical protein
MGITDGRGLKKNKIILSLFKVRIFDTTYVDVAFAEIVVIVVLISV